MTARAQQKQPYIPFYPGDWKKDAGVQALDFFDRHVWFEMLMLMHDSDQRGYLVLNGRPISEDALARLLGLDKQILSKSLSNIKANGVYSVRESDGAIYSRSMVRRADVSVKRAISGKSGGNPSLLKQNASKTQSKTEANPQPNSDNESDNANDNEDEILNLEKSHPELTSALEYDDPFPFKAPFDTPNIQKLAPMARVKLEQQGRHFTSSDFEVACMACKTAKGLEAALLKTCWLSKPFNIQIEAAHAGSGARGDPPKHNKSVTKVLEMLEEEKRGTG